MARPTLYKQEYCDMLIEHMSKGLSFESFAAITDTCLDTLYEWAEKHPEFSEAKKKAFQKCRLWWEQQGQDGMWGGKNFHPAMWVYNMKCRFRKEWTENAPKEQTSKGFSFFKKDDQSE